jgi:hypothetical protein
VLAGGVLDAAPHEHLDLVELMDADDAAGVLAVGAGLPAVARRPAGVAQRAVREVDDLAGVVPGECHLAGADEVQVIRTEVVDLVRVGAEEAGAGHDLGLDQCRGDDGREARGDRPVHRAVQQRELEPRADAGEEVEARPRDLRAAVGVDRA